MKSAAWTRLAAARSCSSGGRIGPSFSDSTRALMISARDGFSKPGTMAPAISSIWPEWPAWSGEKTVFMNWIFPGIARRT